ncbi:MAG: PAS domain-containing protein [Anaeromyxobacter sp.]|nr:PAS domain-containing protein [Anaeromyxobacter sp.]
MIGEAALQELALFLRQLGGGPGADPANAVPRYVIPAVFWVALALAANRQYRRRGDARDLLMGVAAAAGLFREAFLLTVEYGSHRGLFEFSRVVIFYPPVEHALELATLVVAGYAFLAAFRGRSRLLSGLLWAGLACAAALYLATSISWAVFVDMAEHLPGASRLEFAQHWGDLAFRSAGVGILSGVVLGLLTVRGAGLAPRIAALAFGGFLLDYALMLVNIGTGLRHGWLLAPVRHTLHMWAVPTLLGVYWLELGEAVRRGEERLALVLEGSSDGFWDWDLVTRGLVVGERGAALLGRQGGALTSHVRAWRELVHAEDLPPLEALVGRVFAGQEALIHREVRMRHADGTWRWIEVRGKVVVRLADGRPSRAAGTIRDVTAARGAAEERRELEVRIQQAQKLKSLGLLAGGVAHDFNNLLTVVRGNLDEALRALPDGEPREQVGQARAGSQRAVELTAQLLAYAGRGETPVQPLHLSRLAAEMAMLVRSSLPRRCRLVFDLPEDLPWVEANATQLRQVVMNLLLNAAQAMGEREGAITLRTSLGEFDHQALARSPVGEGLPEGRYLALEVCDEGAGMTAETRARIFDPFFTTKADGRGLGLSVVLGVLQAHRGALTVDSEPGVGTTFRMLLPARPDLGLEVPPPGGADGPAPPGEPGEPRLRLVESK